jgi:uncharacterized membrane-anchored protein
LAQLAKDLNGRMVFSGDVVSLLIPKNKLTDNDELLVWLAAYFLGQKLGSANSDFLSKDELQFKLGKSGKIASTRLGILVKNDFAAKTVDEKFRIKTFGVPQIQKEVPAKIKLKMNS